MIFKLYVPFCPIPLHLFLYCIASLLHHDHDIDYLFISTLVCSISSAVPWYPDNAPRTPLKNSNVEILFGSLISPSPPIESTSPCHYPPKVPGANAEPASRGRQERGTFRNQASYRDFTNERAPVVGKQTSLKKGNFSKIG